MKYPHSSFFFAPALNFKFSLSVFFAVLGAGIGIGAVSMSIFFLSSGVAHAQQPQTSLAEISASNVGTGNAIWSIELTPKNPRGNSRVTAKAVSYVTNLNNAVITWYLDGVEQLSGAGETSFTFTAPPDGSSSTLRVVLETENMGTLQDSVTISPSDVDVLWVADTYAPPFYKGKALPSPQSRVVVVAIPHIYDSLGNPLKTKEVFFTWKKTYQPIPTVSGIGKNIISYHSNYANNDDIIGVSVAPLTGPAVQETTIKNRVTNGNIVFYEDRPLEGIRYEKALGREFHITESDVRLAAEPYFFPFLSKNDTASQYKYEWSVNGKPLMVSGDIPSEAAFGKPEDGGGRAEVSLSLKNLSPFLVQPTKKILLSF